MSFVTHLECSACGKVHAARQLHNLCACGRPLLVRYDLREAAQALRLADLAGRPATLWRYREVLPVEKESSVICLGEGMTPLLHARRLGERLGLPNLYLKDEAQNPTASFKARGMALAVSMARELGVKRLAVPTAGNAGGALAAYAAAAEVEAHVFMPETTPLANRLECELHGAKVVTVKGSIKDSGRAMREQMGTDGWFDVSTLKEPYRLEGKKTMAFEVFEQLGRVPEAMISPAGGGTGLIGMWKAFEEMAGLGWIDGKRPRMFAVQAAGCAPIVKAFAQGSGHAEEWLNPETCASGLKVPSAVGDALMLRALRESRGHAVAVTDEAMLAAVKEIAETEGLITAPEAGATLAALKRLLEDGFLAGHETIVLFLTASGFKYLEVLEHLAN